MRRDARTPNGFRFSLRLGKTVGLGDVFGGGGDGVLDYRLVHLQRDGEIIEHHFGPRRIKVATTNAVNPPEPFFDIFEPTTPRQFVTA